MFPRVYLLEMAIWGMVKIALSPVGGSSGRTLCILVFLYFLKIYEHSETCVLKLQFLKCLQGWWGWRIFFIAQKIVIWVVILLLASKPSSCGTDVNMETASSWCHLEVWCFSTFLMVSSLFGTLPLVSHLWWTQTVHSKLHRARFDLTVEINTLLKQHINEMY